MSDSEIKKLCDEVERKLQQTENGCEFSEIEASDVRQLVSALRERIEGERRKEEAALDAARALRDGE